jgi:hypothetical protein
MTDHEFPQPSLSVLIDHPAQPGWLQRVNELYSDERKAKIVETFEIAEEDQEDFLRDVDMAANFVDSKRMTHESESRGLLGLNDDESLLEEYLAFAMGELNVVEYLGRFSLLGQAALRRNPGKKKLGVELGGMRQAGEWSGTGQLDARAESIPEGLTAKYPTAVVDILKGSKHIQKNYVTNALHYIQDGRYVPDFPNLLVRRRRGAANVWMPGMYPEYPIHIVKEASAVVLRRRMDEREAEVVHDGYATYEMFQQNNGVKNSRAAGAAGRAFEQSIHAREASKVVFPVSAHFYAVMHRLVEPHIEIASSLTEKTRAN